MVLLLTFSVVGCGITDKLDKVSVNVQLLIESAILTIDSNSANWQDSIQRVYERIFVPEPQNT